MGVPVPAEDLPVSRKVPYDDLPNPGIWDTVKEAATGAGKNIAGIGENIANQVTQLGAMTLTAVPNIIGSTGAELASSLVNERMPTFKGIGDKFHANLEPQIYQPQTDSGKRQVEATGKTMTAIPAAIDAIDEATGDTFKRNMPNTYAATQVAGEFLPWIVGGKALHNPGKPSVVPKAGGKTVPLEDLPPEQPRAEAPKQEAPRQEVPPSDMPGADTPPPDYTSKTEPSSPERTQYEIALTADPNTSKAAMMLPQVEGATAKDVTSLSRQSGLQPLKEGPSFYLYNPKQTTAPELRAAIKNGTEGNLLGYGTDAVPATGIDYAVSVDGRGTVDLPTIKQWRDNNQLGFAGRALDAEMATAKMQEMGAKQIEQAPTVKESLIVAPDAPQAPVTPLEAKAIQPPSPEQTIQPEPLNIQPDVVASEPIKTEPLEVVQEAVKVAKEEGTPLKEQKKFLLENIDDAITEAPSNVPAMNQLKNHASGINDVSKNAGSKEAFARSREQIAELHAQIGKVTIHVPDDGIFQVLNTKEALADFKSKVSKMFPTGPETKPKEGYGNLPKATGVKPEGLENFVAMDAINGKDFHTNGDVALFGKSTIKPKSSMETVKAEGVKRQTPKLVADYMVLKGEEPVTRIDFVALSDKAPAMDKNGHQLENAAFNAKSSEPIKVGKDETAYVRLTAADGRTADVNQKYYTYVKHHHPNAEPHISAVRNPVKFVENGEVVAVVMPLNLGENVRGRITDTLRKPVSPNEAPTGRGHADTGGYSDRPSAIRETTQTFLEQPEMLKLAKAINEGKIPKLMERMGNALGRFTHRADGEASIKLRKDLFAGPQIAAENMKTKDARAGWEAWQKSVQDAHPDADIIFRQKFNRKSGNVDFKAYKRDPNYVLKTFAHEIGHNVDYLPDSMVRGRGNILGHIGALKKYMKHTLEMYPDAKGKALTPEDRARLAKEARADMKDGADIVETVTREVPKYADAGVTPEMITEIWNGMGDARNLNPDLYKFIAKMSDAEKKQVVVQAMKGVVDERLKSLGKQQVGTETITETITRPGSVTPEAIRRRTQQLIKEEIIKRRLYEKTVITDELKALTQKWKPFDDTANAEYTKYRYSSAELYADATSVLFNEPQLLKDTAPTFYKAFFYHMGERPAFKEAYTAISRMSKDPQALGADRYAEEMGMYQKGNEKAEEIRKAEKPHETIYNTAMRWLIDKNHQVLKNLPDTKAGREARYILEEIPYIAGEAENYVRKVDNIKKEMEATGATVDDLSAYMLAKHIISNRDGIANTLGKTAATEKAKLDWMKQNLGAGKYAALEKAAADYRKAREHVITRMEESGIVTPDLLEKIKNNADYAHIDVQVYMDQKYGKGTAAGAGWKKMSEGTLEDINNVYTATVLQDISIMRMAKINEAKRGITDVFSGNGLAKQAEMKYDTSFKGMRPVEPGGEQALLTVLQKGKPVYYVVDSHVVDMFHRDPVQALQIGKAAGLVQTFFRDILVSKNPAWMARNIFRDFKGTVKNNPEVSFWNPVDRWRLLKAYKAAFNESRADVFHGNRSADIEMMHNEHMLNSDRMYSAKDDSFDNPLERLATEFRFGEQESSNKATKALKAVYEYADKMGKVSEQTGKIAGMKFLREKGLDGNDLSHRVRARIGTPDYKRQGSLQQLTNNIFMFSNVNKEGLRSATEAFKHDPVSYVFKTVEANILPKVALVAAGAGLLGDDLKDVVNAVPSWVKRSYNVIPLPGAFTDWAASKGFASAKDAGYLKLPSDYEGQFFGSLTYDLSQGKYADAFSDIAQQMPWTPAKIHPALKLAGDVATYLGGESPRDDFRHKDVLTAEQKKYLEVQGASSPKALKGMALHSYNMLGLGNVYQLDNKEFPKQKAAEEAAFKQVMRYMGGFVEFSDAGKQEQMVKGIIENRNNKALKSYEAGDQINEAIRSGKDKPTDIAAVYKALVADKTIDPVKTRYGAFRARYMNTIMQKDYGIKPNSKAEQKTLRDFSK